MHTYHTPDQKVTPDMITATYYTKTSTRRVHLVVPGTHHGAFYSDGYGASGHIYTPADDYTLCGNLTRYGGYSTTGEQTTDGAKATCKVCAKRFAALLNGTKPERFAVVVLDQGDEAPSYIRCTGHLERPWEFTSDVTQALQYDNADIAVAHIVGYQPTFAIDTVRV